MHILHNARILSDYHKAHPPSAVLIDNGFIQAIGSDDEILNLVKPGDKVENMQGKTIWPGLIDAHIHLQNYAFGLQKIDCETNTLGECLKRVESRSTRAESGTWILGHGWNQNVWGGNFGSLLDLDRITPNNPTYLTAKSLHAAWANTLALQIAGITSHTPDPPGGIIQRDQHGQPTGILLESAMSLIENIIPKPTTDQISKAISEALPHLWKFGLTGIHDFDRAACFSALQQLQGEGKLKLRILKSIPYENLQSATSVGLRSGFGNDFLRIGSLKLFADGALGPRTAAMLRPYDNTQDETGLLLLDSEQLFEIGRQAVTQGISLTVHAIGDRANHEVLNAYEQLRRYELQNNISPKRHRIEHVQILHPNDLGRLSKLSIIASMQPIHATSDMLMADRNWGRRSETAYAWQSLYQERTILAFGSDAPVESPNPFWGLHAAVNRRRHDGTPGPEGWYPNQRLPLHDALNAYTVGPAFAAGMENRQGRLVPGFFADLIVLPINPFDLTPHDIKNILPDATMIAGEWVWKNG